MSNPPPENPPPLERDDDNARPAPATPPAGTTPDDWIVVGRIVAPFGLKGDVKLIPQTDFPERLAAHAALYLGVEHRPLHPTSAKVHGGVVLLHFAGIEDMTAAETLRGQIVAIPANEAAPLAADQYYIHDLIGLRAVHVNGTDLGSVADILTGAAQDLLVVRRPGQPDALVPFVAALVPAVDVAARTVTIDPPPGLFDENWLQG
jgi:16S rRNA processing protein RimM